MKYLLSKKFFENHIIEQSTLLEIYDNVDYHLLNIIESLMPNGKILEISCGNGADSIELLKKGYSVFATDNNQKYVDYVNGKKIKCFKHDTIEKFPFKDNSFDLTYSRLGLHYFSESDLKVIFKDINRITKKYLVFTVKLVNDIQTGKNILSREIWENIVERDFNIISSNVRNGILYENKSTWLEITALKK